MQKEEAIQHGLGYACGREDASGIKTVAPGPEKIGWLEFGHAFGQGYDDYNTGKRFCMTNCRSAYEAWQATDGATIFGDECHKCRRYPHAMEVATKLPICLECLPVSQSA